MMEPSQNNNGVTLTLHDYRDIGALEEALSAHADEVLKNDLTTEQQRIAQTLFRRLTERVIGRGDRRRPTTLGDVAKVAGVTNEEVAAVVEKFRQSDRSFLTPPPGVLLTADTIVDITHESLITLWHTLDGWVDDEARSAAAYDRLKKTANDWPKDAELLGGINLERAQDWRKKQEPTVAWARRYGTDEEFGQTIKFLDASEREWAVHLEREADRERSLREIEIERERLKAKAKVAMTLKLLTAALAVVAIMAVVAAAYARRQTRLATDSMAEARSQELKATSAFGEATKQRKEADVQRGIAESQRQIAELAANEAEAQKIEAEKLGRKAAEEAQLARKRENDARVAESNARVAQVESDRAKAEAIAERNKAFALARQLARAQEEARKKADEAIASAEQLKIERDLLQQEKKNTEEALALAREAQTRLNVELKNNVFQTERTLSTQAAFSADASRIFTFSRGQGASVWNTNNSLPVKTIKASGDFLSAAFSRDGGRMVTATENGDLVLTDLVSQKQRRFPGTTTKPSRVILSADANRLAVLDGATGTAKIVDLISGKTLAGVTGTWSPIVSMSFSDDGKQLAVIALDGESKLLQARPGEQVSIVSLTTTSCRSNSFDLLDFNPRPDLRARLSLSIDCGGSRPNVEGPAVRGLTPAQAAHALGPAADDAKAADQGTKKPDTQDTLTKKEKPADSIPKATPTPNATPISKTQLTPPVEVIRQPRLESISLSIAQRQKDGSFSTLIDLEKDRRLVGGSGVLSLTEQLRARGISDDLIRKISVSINRLADKLAEIKGDTPEDAAKRHKLAFDVFNEILDDLDLDSD